MKAAKIIALVALILNVFLSYSGIATFINVKSVLQELGVEITPVFVFLLPAFAIINFFYWLYLRSKEKRNEEVKFALWVSLIFLLLPWLFLFPAAIITMIIPLYELLAI